MDREKQERANLYTFLGLLALVIPLNLRMTAPYMLSLFMGAILALISDPVYQRLLARGWGKKRAALLVTLGGLLLIIAPVGLFLSKAAQQAAAVGQHVAQSEALSFQALTDRLAAWGPTSELIGQGPELERQLRGAIQSAGKAASGGALKLIAALPVAAVQLALACLAWFFMLKDGPRFVDWLTAKLPLDDDVREKIVESLKSTSISTVWSTLAAAAAQATVMAGGFWVLGIPAVFLAWGATFILSWFPIVGSVPVSAGAVLWLYSQGEYARAGAMAGVGALVTLVDNVVRPWVLKGREDLHPFVGLLAVIAGIDLFGILGAFVGPVLVSIAIALLNLWPVVARRFGFSLEPRPAGPEERPPLPPSRPWAIWGRLRRAVRRRATGPA